MQVHSEEWRPAPHLDGYEVSSLGRARRFGASSARKLKQCKRGYHWLSVANGKGSSRNISVARLVCEAFHGAPAAPGMDSDHINRNRGDDRPSNLRWVTRAENLQNRACASGDNHWNRKLSAETVRVIRASSETNTALAARLGVARRTIADVRNGKTWSHIDGQH